jgi:hypothetical protein
MARKFAYIPPIGNANDRQVLTTVADAVSYLTGQTQPQITTLPTTATNAEIIAKLNQILNRIQGN